MALAVKDFAVSAPKKAEQLTQLLQEARGVFDRPMEEGIQLALQNERLLTHYWVDSEAREDFFDVLSAPETTFDVPALLSMLREFEQTRMRHLEQLQGLEVPAIVIFGEQDPISVPDKELAIARRLFSDVRVEYFAASGHWPHVERPHDFVNLLLSVA